MLTPELTQYLQMLADQVSMCKVDHQAVKLDEAAWQALEYVGIQDPDTEWALELRNCTCGSTLARKVSVKSTSAIPLSGLSPA